MKIYVFLLCVSLGYLTPKKFIWNYYPNGKVMSGGWMLLEKKVDFWRFYYQNGNKKSEGNYKDDKKNGYWYYYNLNGILIKEGHYKNDVPEMWWKYYKKYTHEKCKFQNDGKTRFCLIYSKNKIIKGSKYINDTFVKEWTSINRFKKDNPNFTF